MYSREMLIILISTTLISNTYGYGRIVGGNEITIEKRPYTASLQYIYEFTGILHHCGASIISTRFVLSAAHCNPDININNLYVRVGSTFYNEGGQLLKVGSFVDHPGYQTHTLEYDFAIVTFANRQEIVLGPNAAIIPLTNNLDHGVNSLVAVTGWGVTQSAGNVSVTLKEVIIPIFNFDQCKESFPHLTPSQICIGGTTEGNQSSCNVGIEMFKGDSGGPAMQFGEQIGVVSGGVSCHLPYIPGIYSRISSVRSWITCICGV